jgi:hypothetical protein
MTESPEPPDLSWDAVVRAIGARLWKLAPEEHQRSGHNDICFPVCHQNLMDAVVDGIWEVVAANVDHLYDDDETKAMCGYDLTNVPEGREFPEMCPRCVHLAAPAPRSGASERLRRLGLLNEERTQ